jgi:hypothetical protein
MLVQARSLALLGALTVAITACAGHGDGRTAAARTMSPRSATVEPQFQPPEWLADTSVWNAPVADDAALDDQDDRIVAHLAQQAKSSATVATTEYGVTIYRVPADQPTRKVTVTSTGADLLQQAFNAVPLPADAHGSAGTDGAAVVVQPSTDTAWEFWRLKRNTDTGRFTAGWGGRLLHLSTHRGYYRDVREDGDLVERWFWGPPATKFAKLGGVVTVDEWLAGRIDHAVAIAVPKTRAGVFAFPAQATDGKSSSKDAVPEGAHFRLDPKVDVDALDVPPATKMLALAAQRYGLIVDNQAGTGVSFVSEDPSTLDGPNPYPDRIFGGVKPYLIAKAFPWSRLQLLRMDLRTQPHPDE